MHVVFMFFECLTLYYWALWGTIESSTHPWPLPGRHWRTCEVSSLYLKNCANACCIHVFWVFNPLLLSPLGYHRIVNPSTTCPGKSLMYLWSFSSLSLKLCECIETEGQTETETILFIDIDYSHLSQLYGSTTVVMAIYGLHWKWRSLTPCQKHPSEPIEKIFGTIDYVIDLE